MSKHVNSFSSRRVASVAGVTLLEVLLASLVLSIGIAGMLQGIATGLRMNQRASAAFLVSKGIQEYQLERMRSWDFLTLASADTGVWIPVPLTGPSSDPALAQAIASLRNGQAQYKVDPDPATPDARLKRVTILVSWTDPDGRARSSTISTLIGCRGLRYTTVPEPCS